MGEPHPFVKKEFEYMRKACFAHYNNKKIRYWIYSKLAKHYEKKHMKLFLSS